MSFATFATMPPAPMTMTETIPMSAPATAATNRAEAVEHARMNCLAVKVAFTWFGTKKGLSESQKEDIAESFGAEPKTISAAKRIIDTKHPAMKAVTALKTQITKFWKENSLPYPDPGIRLIPQARLDYFQSILESMSRQLTTAVADLEDHYYGIKTQARERLGRLYDPADYPGSLIGLFGVSWEFPSVEPPDYLMQLRPDLYESERARVTAKYDEAVKLAEEAFAAEFAGMVSHLVERITGLDEKGEKKVFRDTAVENLTDFFARFRTLNLHSNPELDALVDQAQDAINSRHVTARRLRADGGLRATVAADLASIASQLERFTTVQPRRRVQRPDKPATVETIEPTPTAADMAERIEDTLDRDES